LYPLARVSHPAFSPSLGRTGLRIRRFGASLFLVLAALVDPPQVLAQAGVASPPPAPLELEPCQLEDAGHVSVVLGDCGNLDVAEDPHQPGGRHIALHVARVSAVNRRKQADPLFVLAGGPGMAASSFYASAAPAFERIRRERDIVLIDQRGTGSSNPLNCKLTEDDLTRATDAEVSAEAEHCLTSLRPRARVEFYNTSIAVQDLDLARAALGYERINLYGVSYGTRVAQHYIRRFPTRVRAAVLDGVVPPQLALGPASAVNAERALERIFARCTQDAACQRQFGDLTAAYHSVRATLQKRPVEVSLPDPTSAQPARMQFAGFQLANVLRLASYTAEQAALLPLMLHSAAAAENYAPLAAQYLLVSRGYGDAVAYGMHNSVVCSEDVPFYHDESIDRAALAKTYLGVAQLDGLRSICSVWPRGPIDADFHEPLRTSVPLLLLSGSDDPVTPPQDAEAIRGGFAHSVHVILNGFGHGQLTAPCIDRLMATFIERGSVEGLDVSCVAQDRPLPFFTSSGGPPP
jgi:pimeloyl-ACP methyl ester carboxylesterase